MSAVEPALTVSAGRFFQAIRTEIVLIRRIERLRFEE